MPLGPEQTGRIAETLRAVRTIEAREGASGDALAQIRDTLIELATSPELQALTPPGHGASGVYYTLDESPEHGYGLYLNVIPPGGHALAHCHGVWCVAAGLKGEERDRFYTRDGDGRAPGEARLHECARTIVRAGAGMYMRAEDIHSVEVLGDTPVAHLHLYARPLGRFPELEFYDLEAASARPAPPPTPVPLP